MFELANTPVYSSVGRRSVAHLAVPCQCDDVRLQLGAENA